MSNSTLKVHPAIGLARVGNSAGENGSFYLAPTTPGGLPSELDGAPVTRFKDPEGRLRRQAVRFSVLVYDDASPGGRPLALGDKLGERTVADIRWTCWLANKKAGFFQFRQLEGEDGYPPGAPLRNPQITDPDQRRAQLIIDPGARTVSKHQPQAQFDRSDAAGSGPGSEGGFPPPLRPHSIDTLGELHHQTDGSCLVLGGLGHSGSMLPGTPVITAYANNPGWFDDVSDGPVDATVVFDDGSELSVDDAAWCIVAPPAYAPEIPNMVTLDDLMFDLFVRTTPGYRDDIYSGNTFNPDYQPSFPDEIYPMLQRALLNQWVSARPQGSDGGGTTASTSAAPPAAHSFGPLNAEAVDNAAWLLSLLRPLGDANAPFVERTEVAAMPFLCGDNPISNDQPAKFLNLTATQLFFMQQWAAGKATDEAAPALPAGEALDRGVLANAVGGPFCPGIEGTWIFRNPAMFRAPYRVKPRQVGHEGLTFNGDVALGAQPGDLTARMAQPWQADFNECSLQDVSIAAQDRNTGTGGPPLPIYETLWWPAQRPVSVYTQANKQAPANWARDSQGHDFADIDMVRHWWRLGFVIEQGPGGYVEVERSGGAFDTAAHLAGETATISSAAFHSGPKRSGGGNTATCGDGDPGGSVVEGPGGQGGAS